MKNRALLVCLALFLVLLAPASGFALKNGDSVPDIFGKTLSGHLFRLQAELGRPKLLNFFSTSCAPCKKELPELAGFEKRYPNVDVIAVHASNTTREKVARFVESLAAAPKVVVCGSSAVKDDFGFLGFPHTILVGPDGTVLEQFVGYTPFNMQRMETRLKGL